ncbi:hypothetical protein CVT24_007009, partial [Panaeolus cyanescens]
PRRSIHFQPLDIKLATALSDGSLFVSQLSGDTALNVTAKWTEPRMGTNKFVGLALTESAVISCTSNGMVQRKVLQEEASSLPQNSATSTVPSRLFDWKLSNTGETFAYGGDEVDLSIWDVEKSFQGKSETTGNDTQTKKRKREQLFPAEVWRAKNLPNDSLNLRQPIRITSLEYIASSNPDQHIVTGTQLGDVRRYDTKAGRRPVSNWKGIGKVGGVKRVAKGASEHELFVSDNGCNLYSLDLRTGGILYGYKGISGAVNSMAFSPSYLASTSHDRYLRVHSTVAPPKEPATNQEQRGTVLTKAYTTATPTCVVWNPMSVLSGTGPNEQDIEDGDDEIWQKMEHVD